MTQTVDTVYSQRNELAIAFCKAALSAGWRAGRGRDSDRAKDWDESWRHVIYVDLPSGEQVSWHMSPAEVPLLAGIPEYPLTWDGTWIAKTPGWAGRV